MTAFDYGLLFLLVVTAGLGFWRGLVSEVLSLVAWVLAIVLGRIYAPQVATWLTTVDHPLGRYALAFLLIFVLVLLLSGVLRWLLQELLKGCRTGRGGPRARCIVRICKGLGDRIADRSGRWPAGCFAGQLVAAGDFFAHA